MPSDRNNPSNQLKPDLLIGNIPIYGKAMLAPMDGITDSPFRQICRQMGSALSVSEFVNALNLINGHPHITENFPFDAKERPFAYQIFDNDIARIKATSIRLLEYHPDFIDINMGCSNRSVSSRGAGAGLMRDPKKVEELFSQLSKDLPVPLTAKIRLGWDDEGKNYLAIAKILEQNGCACIFLHARTRVQQYSENADWDAIGHLVQNISIPVIGNGDILRFDQIDEMLNYTKCNAVMIGRGAIGNPWIFSKKTKELISPIERFQVIVKHLQLMNTYYGSIRGIILFRKHLNKYLSQSGISNDQIRIAYTYSNADELAHYLQDILLD